MTVIQFRRSNEGSRPQGRMPTHSRYFGRNKDGYYEVFLVKIIQHFCGPSPPVTANIGSLANMYATVIKHSYSKAIFNPLYCCHPVRPWGKQTSEPYGISKPTTKLIFIWKSFGYGNTPVLAPILERECFHSPIYRAQGFALRCSNILFLLEIISSVDLVKRLTNCQGHL